MNKMVVALTMIVIVLTVALLQSSNDKTTEEKSEYIDPAHRQTAKEIFQECGVLRADADTRKNAIPSHRYIIILIYILEMNEEQENQGALQAKTRHCAF